jgi:hypothetical protein
MFRTSSATVAAASVVSTSDPDTPNEAIIFNFYQMHVHPVFHINGYITTTYRGKANQPNLIFENTAYIASNLVVSRNVHLDSNVTPAELLIELRPITNNRYRSVYACFPLKVTNDESVKTSSLEDFITKNKNTNELLSQQELNLTPYLPKMNECLVKIDQTSRIAFITFSSPIELRKGTDLSAVTLPTSMPPKRMPRVTSQYKLKAIRVRDSMDDEYYNIKMRLPHDVPSSAGTDIASGIIREGNQNQGTPAQASANTEVIMDCDTFDVDGETVQTLNIPIESEFASENTRGENVRLIAIFFSAFLLIFVTHMAVIPLFFTQLLPYIIKLLFDGKFKEQIDDANRSQEVFDLTESIKRKAARIQLAIMFIIFLLAIIMIPVGATNDDMRTLFAGILFLVLFFTITFGNYIRTMTFEGAKTLVSWEVEDGKWKNVWAYEAMTSSSKKEGFLY